MKEKPEPNLDGADVKWYIPVISIAKGAIHFLTFWKKKEKTDGNVSTDR